MKDGFQFKKKYGQNFLQDSNIIHNIVEKSNIPEDTLVIEIGPGSGALTKLLAKKATQVLCYEIDTTLQPILEQIKDENVTTLFQDFLTSDIQKDIENFSYQHIYVIANLPYYITTPIIMKIMKLDIVEKLVIMVQKEVGNRFKAKPGTKEYNSLSIFLSYYYDIEKIIDVPRTVFKPVPNVDSIVVSMTKKNKLLHLEDKEFFFQLVKDSFTQKRKTLKNNLGNYDLNCIKQVLQNYDMDLSIRAEAIPLEVFVDIANELVKRSK